MLCILALHVQSAAHCLSAGLHLDPRYPSEQSNFLCLNWSKPFELPCKPRRSKWRPKWEGRFVVTAWWPPNSYQYNVYAEAGFNLALTGNSVGQFCDKGGKTPGFSVTKDQVLESIFEAAAELKQLGVLTMASQGNSCNQYYANDTQGLVYGGATGGSFDGRTNITSRAKGGVYPAANGGSQRHIWTVPEVAHIVARMKAGNLSDAFAGVFLHDDTVTQTAEVSRIAAWLQKHAPDIVPQVNQQMGNSGPETLYKNDLFISSPEQYPVSQKNTTGGNATAMAMGQLRGYEDNARQDSRFGLDHWPLFNVGAGVGPDINTSRVRSDSLVRFMANGAVAYGARGLYWYCWGGGIWELESPDQFSGIGKPSGIYGTVAKLNFDSYAWGTALIEAGAEWAGAVHTGWCSGDRGQCVRPSDVTIVTHMDDSLLATVFVTPSPAPTATAGANNSSSSINATAPVIFVYVIDKRVVPGHAAVPARNVTLTLHPSAASALVLPRGAPGAHLFFGKDKVGPSAGGRYRYWRSSGDEVGSLSPDKAGVRVTIELVGGDGALIRAEGAIPTPGTGEDEDEDEGGEEEEEEEDLQAACEATRDFDFATASMGDAAGMRLKMPRTAYDTFNAGFRPYAGLELSDGQSYLDVGREGQQTNLILIGDHTNAPVSGAVEAEMWSKGGYNMLSVAAPTANDLDEWGSVSRAMAATADFGLTYGFFVLASPSPPATVQDARSTRAIISSYKCHTRFAGFVLAAGVVNVNNTDTRAGARASGSTVAKVQRAARAMRTTAPWLLPFVASADAVVAQELRQDGLTQIVTAAAVPPAAALLPNVTAIQRAAAVIELYEAQNASLALVTAIDACASDSDSELRMWAYTAFAFGARGIWWRNAARCAGVTSPKFSLLANINLRLAQWGNTFVTDSREGYELVGRFTSKTSQPPASSMVIKVHDDDLLVAELRGTRGRFATPLLYVVDQRVSSTVGALPARRVNVTLRVDVVGTQPLEGDCISGSCQCNQVRVGRDMLLDLPGGSGQLVAVVTDARFSGGSRGR